MSKELPDKQTKIATFNFIVALLLTIPLSQFVTFTEKNGTVIPNNRQILPESIQGHADGAFEAGAMLAQS